MTNRHAAPPERTLLLYLSQKPAPSLFTAEFADGADVFLIRVIGGVHGKD